MTMRTNLKSLIPALSLMLLLGLAITSCEYKDLCYQHPHWVNVEVKFDWRNDTAANPASMQVVFYDMDNISAEPVSYHLEGRDGGVVQLLPGRYRAIAYNNDTEAILYRNTNLISTMEAYTRLSSINEGTNMNYGELPRGVGKEDEYVILEPDMLWCATHPLFEIEQQDPVTYDYVAEGASVITRRTYTITMVPEKRVGNVTVIVHNVKNKVYSSNFAGALSTLAPSVMMESGNNSDGLVTQAFTFRSANDSTLQANFHYFGHCPYIESGTANTHNLTVYAYLGDDDKRYYNIDVTGQVHDLKKNPDRYNILIEVDSLPLPIPISNGSGLHPTVDGWHEVVIPLPEN